MSHPPTPTPPAATTSTTRLPGPVDIWLHFVGVVVVFALGLGGFFRLDHAGEAGFILSLGVVGYSFLLAIGAVPLSLMMARPLVRLQRQLDAGTPTLSLSPADVSAAQRLPARVQGFVIGFSVVVAVVFSTAVRVRSSTFAPWYVFFIGGLCVAAISSAAHVYALRRLVVARISPILLRDGTLDHLAGSPRARTWQHIGGLVVTLGLAWPTLGYLVIRYGVSPDPIAVVAVIVLYVATTALQVLGTLASISRPVGHLRDRMNEVGAGRLDVRARIENLDTFGELSSSFNHMVDGLKQREFLKETFGRYVTTQVADEILAGRVALGGERRTATVLFSDIRGFTTMSEQLSPEEVVAFLNEFLEMMVDCVLEHGGVLDKFIGDAVLAVFGVPVGRGSVRDDALAAVACARLMGERLAALNVDRVARGKAPINIGIGVHTGELVAGNIGSARRMQYTVIGDTVNVGSRLESLTKEHHRRTLVSGATAALVKDSVPLVALGTATVRGRQEALELFGLTDEVS